MKQVKWVIKDKLMGEVIPPPKPAKNYIPDWYKDIPKFYNKKFTVIQEKKESGFVANTTVKSCIPFFDSLTSGYVQETWCDLYFELKDGELKYSYSLNPQPFSHRVSSNLTSNFYLKEFYPTEFVWKQYWVPKLPKGYSMLITHPLNRMDLPFTTLSGIVDSDVFFESYEDGGNLPFYVKDGFQGIIPAGTPMYQMIPVKRDVWQSSVFLKEQGATSLTKKFFYDGYKKLYWNKKQYN